MPQVTLAALRQILLGLDFTMRRVPGSRIWFEHPDPKYRILLPPFSDDQLVDEGNLVGIRRFLDEWELMDRKRFDELLSERSLAG
jgi:hypothetical protein